jgi:CHAD domain-containing protein
MTKISASKVSAGLRESVRVMHDDLTRKLLALARSVTPAKVHDSRTAIRRLLAVLGGYKRFFRVAPRHRYIVELKQMTTKLDALRDADVMQKTMIDVSAHAKRSTIGERHALLGLTRRNRLQRLAALEADIASGRWSTRITRLRCSAAAALSDVKSPTSMRSSVSHILKRCRRRLRSALDYDGREPRTLHRLRSKVRRMRYLLEQAHSLERERSRLEIRRSCKLQDSLGELHDACFVRAPSLRRPSASPSTISTLIPIRLASDSIDVLPARQ